MRRFFKNLKKKCFFSKFENLAENSHFCSFLDPSSIKGLYRGTINLQGPINGHMNFFKHILDWSKWQKTEFQKFIFDLDGDFFLRMTPFQLTVQWADIYAMAFVVEDLAIATVLTAISDTKICRALQHTKATHYVRTSNEFSSNS